MVARIALIILTMRKPKMASKAEELVDKLRGIAENYQQVTNNPPMYNLGDAVTIMRDGFEYVALIEAIDEDEYTIRVQAIAGNEFEATDKVYVVNAEDLVMYSAPKSFAIGDVVEWKSQAGITIGEIVGAFEDESGNYVVEVFAQDEKGQYDPTNVTVTLSGDVIERKDDIILPRRRGKIMAKMTGITMQSDAEKKIGILEGIGSAYGQVDLGGDTVKRGAYKQTIKHKNGMVPLFIDHGWDMKTFMGIAYVEDSDEGLKVRAELPLDATDVRDNFIKTQFAVDNGLGMGYSIGYDAIKSRTMADGTRELQEIALYEISITPFPMDTSAKIMSARSKRVAYKAMQTKWATPIIDAPQGNQGTQDADTNKMFANALAELKSILNNKKTPQ
jgi:uncharacterized protein